MNIFFFYKLIRFLFLCTPGVSKENLLVQVVVWERITGACRIEDLEEVKGRCWRMSGIGVVIGFWYFVTGWSWI